MPSTLEFNPSTSLEDLLENKPNSASSNNGQQRARFQDLTFKPEFRSRVLRLKPGLTWLRFLPSIKGSVCPWLYQFGRLEFESAKLVYPTGPLLETAKKYLRENEGSLIYTKEHKSGLKLWPLPRAIAWVIDADAPEGERLRIFLASAYRGERGANLGLAAKLSELLMETNQEPGSPFFGKRVYPDITDPRDGRLVGITRTGQGEHTGYSVKIGNASHTLNTELLTDEEAQLICPLEKTVQEISDEQLEKILAAELPADVMAKILS